MGSLSELLSIEGFEGSHKNNFNHKKVKFKEYTKNPAHDSIALPIYICHDRKSFDHVPRHKKSFSQSGSSVISSKAGRRSSLDEPAIDEIATKAMISILSGYPGLYLRDKDFRDTLREKCYACLARRSKGFSDNGVFGNLELGIKSVDKLIENSGTTNELKMKSLKNSMGFLTIVASLNSKGSKNGTTCGTPNSYLSACAHLYLSIVYKLEKNERVCARHVLQVFVEMPSLARNHLLPDLWEHFFLPHLLHLKIWYNKQVENLSDFSKEREEEMRCLCKAYDDQMDMGTTQFALYYKHWLETGAQPPITLPSVPLPSIKSSSSSYVRKSSSSQPSINDFLYRSVFGPPLEKQQHMPSMDFDDGNGSIAMEQEEEEKLCLDDYNTNQQNNVEDRITVLRRSSRQSSRSFHKPDYTRFLPCQNEQIIQASVVKTRIISPPSDLSKAVNCISNSESLSECELAIRIMTKAWLDSQGNDTLVKETLSKTSVIEGMVEVLFSSNDEEILELVISLLTEFVSRNEIIAKIIMSLDPQLEAFIRLMRNSSLFLKAASLLHLVKPKAKQMISTEWIPLVLRVLEFGDQTQKLFTVRCSPQVAAYYFLDQLLNGFDEDRNSENGKQVISLGGLKLLLRRIEIGDIVEKSKAFSALYSCIRADGRCRHYLADNLNVEYILALLALGNEHEIASSLLLELVCLYRFTQRMNFFNGLLRGWNCLNTMQILLLYLQRATPHERPTVAAVMLQLDLMGDPMKSSVYREEAIEAIIESLNCQICNEKVQEQAAKALMILGGRYSYTGTPEAEKWILKEAGFNESLEGAFRGRYGRPIKNNHLNKEDEETEKWQRKAAMVLWRESLIRALGESIANGIPCLARASLVTVAWMSNFIHTVGIGYAEGSSALVPHLIESLNDNYHVEERVLASFSLHALSYIPGSQSIILEEKEKKEVLDHLRNISKLTWTAKKLASIIVGKSG